MTVCTTKKDPGLQVERTQLAWIRTLFLLALVGVFFLRVGFIENSILLCLSGAFLLLLLIGVKLYQYCWPDYFNIVIQRKHGKLLFIVASIVCLSNLLLIVHYIAI